MTREEKVALVQVVYDGFNAKDFARIEPVLTDDVELVDMATGQTLHGKDGFSGWLGVWQVAAPDARAEVTSVVVEGDRVATEHTGRATHTGPLPTPAGEIPPTGRRFELQFAEIFDLRDGRIARMTAYWDSASLLRQLGLLG